MKKERIKFPLGRKIAFMAIALALCLSIQMIVFNYLNYKEEMFEHFEHDGQKICASVAARLIIWKQARRMRLITKHTPAFAILSEVQG